MQGIVLFGRDLAQIPCFRESFFYGISSGIGVGLAAFIKTSKPMLSQHIGVGSAVTCVLGYWFVCRYQWSKSKIDAMLLQEAMNARILREGTITDVDKELESKGVLESV